MPANLLDGFKNTYETAEASKGSGGGGNYLNTNDIQEGSPTRITILGTQSVSGYVVWGVNSEGKNRTLKFSNEPTRDDIQERANEEGITFRADPKPKPCYAFWVWNYDEEKVQCFQFEAKSLIDPIYQNLSDDEIGQEPHAYDFKLSHNGLGGTDKRFIVNCVPGKRRQAAVNKQIEAEFDKLIESGAELSNILIGGDPFKPATPF